MNNTVTILGTLQDAGYPQPGCGLTCCGGIIKKQNDDFTVSEVIIEKAHSRICSDSGYAVYKLKKNGIDTTHALGKIFKKHGLNFDIIHIAKLNEYLKNLF